MLNAYYTAYLRCLSFKLKTYLRKFSTLSYFLFHHSFLLRDRHLDVMLQSVLMYIIYTLRIYV